MTQYTNINEIESQSGPTARGLRILFTGALLVLSGVTSMAFFATYAWPMFAFLVGVDLAPYMAGLTGALCFEIASIVWSYLRANDAGTNGQIATATTAHWMALAGGVTVTIIYMVMSSELIAPYLDSRADLVLALIGMVLIVAGVAGNFLAASLYLNSGPSHTQATHEADIRALQAGVYYQIAQETARATLSRTMEEIQRELPGHAGAQALVNSRGWMASQFSHQTPQDGPGESVTYVHPQYAQNGTGGGERPEPVDPPEGSG